MTSLYDYDIDISDIILGDNAVDNSYASSIGSLSTNDTDNEEVQLITPPKNRNAYMMAYYYNKRKEEIECVHCGNFHMKAQMPRHKRSLKCMKIQKAALLNN
jgi:hypothetical protein